MKRACFIVAMAVIVVAGCAATGTTVATPNATAYTEGYELMDVHGAGAQRSDPKTGNPEDFPIGQGPQGDVRRVYNLVRLVRGSSSAARSYPVVDTGQAVCYDERTAVGTPVAGSTYDGQDAQKVGLAPNLRDNGDGTVSDLVTGLMWQRNPGVKLTYAEAKRKAEDSVEGGYDDWRLPTIKELYSLIRFDGEDPDPAANSASQPFIDDVAFAFAYGDVSSGDRIIDAQYISSTEYVSTTMGGNATAFGVNFADGRIKGYPTDAIGETGAKAFFVLPVRGNPEYGKNDFVLNAEGTITDRATGLEWDQADSARAMDWVEALAWTRSMNAANYKGHSDWRLPDAKELQSIVDYSRSPDTTFSAAIDPLFAATVVTDEGGGDNYGFYWTGTTHVRSGGSGSDAVYVAFGEALGFMRMGGRGFPPPRRR